MYKLDIAKGESMSNSLKIVVFIMVVFNMVYNAFLPLHPDEAYYWVWSQNLQLSYFDHPPMVAYFIKLFTIAGNSEFFVRLVSIFCITGAGVLNYSLGKELLGAKVAGRALLLFLFMPLTQGGYHIVTPDAPFILFWSLSLYFLHKAIFKGDTKAFYITGIMAGLMMLSKYPGVLLFPAVLLFLLLSEKYRHLLFKKEIYLAVMLAIAVFSPVIIWNAQHNWVSFAFQLSHGMGGAKVINWNTFGMFVAGQAGVANPIFFVAMVFYFLKNIKQNIQDEKLSFLLWPFLVPILFFGYAALFSKSEPNWPATAYFTGTILLAYWLTAVQKRWILISGVVLTTVLISITLFPQFFPWLPPKAALLARVSGSDIAFKNATSYINAADEIVISDSFQNASCTWYYMPQKEKVYILTPVRPSTYDFWNQNVMDKGISQAIFIGDVGRRNELAAVFERVELVTVVKYEDRYAKKQYEVYRCYNYKGKGI